METVGNTVCTMNYGGYNENLHPESGPWDLVEISGGSGEGTLFSRKKRQESAWMGQKKEKSLWQKTCLADKTNLPVERLSLNRSQCGSCSTKYDTSAGT